MNTFISVVYSVLCALMCIGLIYRLFKSEELCERITCGVALVPFLLRAFRIR
jgi:hypothetical protein